MMPPLPAAGAFLAGTHITTLSRHGVMAEVPVESLNPGDTLLGLAGPSEKPSEIRAIHHVTSPDNHPHPNRVTPIRIRAGALAPAMPAQDLILPPDALLRLRDSLPPDVPIGDGEDPGYLVPAAALLNATSITRDPIFPHTWFVLELDTPDIILANATPVAADFRNSRRSTAFSAAKLALGVARF